jgi:hypothetical protein
MSYDEISQRTLPQIQEIRKRLGKNIALKIGMPSLFGGALDAPEVTAPTGKPSKLSDFMSFASQFNGI